MPEVPQGESQPSGVTAGKQVSFGSFGNLKQRKNK